MTHVDADGHELPDGCYVEVVGAPLHPWEKRRGHIHFHKGVAQVLHESSYGITELPVAPLLPRVQGRDGVVAGVRWRHRSRESYGRDLAAAAHFAQGDTLPPRVAQALGGYPHVDEAEIENLMSLTGPRRGR